MYDLLQLPIQYKASSEQRYIIAESGMHDPDPPFLPLNQNAQSKHQGEGCIYALSIPYKTWKYEKEVRRYISEVGVLLGVRGVDLKHLIRILQSCL